MKSERSVTSLFLLELLLGLLIFAWCAAVCTRLFTTSLETAQDTADYTRAVQIAQNIAEQYQNGVSQQTIAGRWNASGEPDEQGEYDVELSVKDASDGLSDAIITIRDCKGKVIYTLKFSRRETEI